MSKVLYVSDLDGTLMRNDETLSEKKAFLLHMRRQGR